MSGRYLCWLMWLLMSVAWADDATCLIPDYYAELSLRAHWQQRSLSHWQQQSLRSYADSASSRAYLSDIAVAAFQLPMVAKKQQSAQLYGFVEQVHQRCLRDFGLARQVDMDTQH